MRRCSTRRRSSAASVASISPYGSSVATKISLRFSRPKRVQIDRQVMLVRHHEADAGDVVDACRAPPAPSRTACAEPTGCRARRTTRAASSRTASPRRAESTCPSRGTCHVAVSDVASRRSRVSGSVVNSSRGKPANAESRRLQDDRSAMPAPTVDAVARRPRRAPCAVSGPRRMNAWPCSRVADRAMRRQRCSARSIVHARQLRIALQEMPAERSPNGSGSRCRRRGRQRIHGVLHRVGRQHVAIVAVGVGCVVVALESGSRPSDRAASCRSPRRTTCTSRTRDLPYGV